MSASGKWAAMSSMPIAKPLNSAASSCARARRAIRDDHAAQPVAHAGGALPARSFRPRRRATPCVPQTSRTPSAPATPPPRPPTRRSRRCESGSYPLGDRERGLHRAVEIGAGDLLIQRRAIRVLQLAEDLRLADHQGIQAASDREQVLDRRRTLQAVQRFIDVQPVRRQVMPAGQPIRHFGGQMGPGRVGLDPVGIGRIAAGAVGLRETVEFGAVTGGNDQRFTHAGDAGERPQCFRQLLARKDYFFADIDGRGAVIDSYDDEWHAGCCRDRCGLSGKGPPMTSERVYGAQRRRQ